MFVKLVCYALQTEYETMTDKARGLQTNLDNAYK